MENIDGPRTSEFAEVSLNAALVRTKDIVTEDTKD
jgi:hypothetical protein